MIKRNGSTFRTLLMAVVMVALIYFIYLYNGVQSRLKNSEIMSEKLKRDRESLSSQLNDISLEKENVKEKSQKDRLEISSRLNELQNKYKMLQSQHQDMETEYSRIQQKLDKFTEDSKQKDANRNQEFMQLKQEKEMEIVKLKDQNANLFRESEQYKAELINVKQQLQQQQKNIMNNQMDTGGGGGLGAAGNQFMNANQQPVQQQQQQPVLQQGLQQGLLNDVQNGNVMGRILHQPPNNHMGFGQQAQMVHAGNLDVAQHGLPVKREVPVEQQQQQFQIQPADIDHAAAAGHLVANDGKELDLQKQEAEQRQQQQGNEHNQVQPPINNPQLEKQPNKTGADKPAHPMEAPNAPVANDQQQNVLIAPAANEKVHGLKNILMPPNKDDLAKQVLPVNNGNANDVGIDFPVVDNGNMRVQL